MLVVMGIIEFGRGMMATQIVVNAAREGAREAILTGSTNALVRAAVRDFVSDTCRVPAASVQVDISIAPGPGNTNPNDILANSNQGDLVTVDVRVPFSDLSYITGKFLNGLTLKGIATMRHE